MANEGEVITELLIEEEMKDSYLNYAMSVIVSRALPDVRDGLKPSQRRILVAMNDLGLTPRAKHRKCAKIAGDTSGNYHPHGEQVIYPTLVRMAQEFASRSPLVDGQGNFGSVDGDPPAAMRYTEARMTAAALLMMEDIDKATVDFVPNYDETREEPTVLPSKFPNLLANGSSGIAVGMATSIPPHNLGEVCDALIKLVENPEVTVSDLLQIIKGPDFPTGAQICGTQGIREAYETGRGLLTVRSHLKLEETKNKTQLIFTDIPYNANKAKIIERIAELVKEDRIQGISDVRDESDKEGMRIVVDLKRDVDPRVITNQLYANTPLQDTFSVIMIALVNNRPRLLNIKQFLEAYRDHRMEVIRRRTRYLLEKAEAAAHILEGLIIAIANIDEVIEIIKTSPDVPSARSSLMKRFGLDVPQADAILEMRLARLTNLESDKLRQDLEELRDKIKEYKAILSNENLVLDIIREDLYEMKEAFPSPRRTEITGAVEELAREDLIVEEDVAVIISHLGYIKRMPLGAARKQGRGGRGIIAAETREGDFLEHIFVASTHDYLLFFSDRGKVYWQKVYELPLLPRGSKGRAIANLLEMAEGEAISAVLPVREFEKRFLFFATQSGLVKKTPLEEFGNPRKGGLIALRLEDGDKLIGVRITTGKDHVVLGTANGMAIRFSEEEVRPMGRATYGVNGIDLRAGDRVQDLVIVDPQGTLLTVCENGYGKRSSIEDYRVQSRAGLGIINIRTTERNGKVVALKAASETDDLMMITSQGMFIRIPVKSMSVLGRATQGVRLIRLAAGDRLVSCAQVAHEEGVTSPEDVVPPEEQAEEAAGETPPEGGAAEAPDAPGEPPATTEPPNAPPGEE
ncbi:MAG: DNA gyrase subunit A [Planctomycetes bacterium]|nr:DNA gyrase subunit A [Planctomycetota bacterium]